MQLIITGHGHYATGLQSTVQLLAGTLSGVEFIDFTAEMSESDLEQQFPKMDDLVFFCDLVGGTPYKQAVLIASQYKNVAVVAGCNIGALLEVALQNDIPNFEDAHELAQLFIESSHSAIQEFTAKKYVEIPEDEGI
ncbi:MAG: PTS sugar transporter subunit IIA [Streptococcaceae bacterium]|nr:PTS sugar transporter subunit IIA [Streptococcaceae bacterium]